MKRFKFSLQVLLRLRKRKEEQVKRELAAKQRQLFKVQEALKQTGERLNNLQAEQKEERSRVADILALRQGVLYRHSLLAEMRQKTREIAALRLEAESIRQRLVKATQEKRSLEMVHDKRFDEWHSEYLAREQEFIDDVSQKVFIRKQKVIHAHAADT
jgi:flagellar FliJ protein